GILMYSQTNGNLISLKSSSSIIFRGLGFAYNSPSYNNHLILTGHSASGADASYLTWEDCSFSGGTSAVPGNAASFISLDGAIICNINRCRFWGANVGIKGIGTNVTYSNVIDI